jgi:hypothetical protein
MHRMGIGLLWIYVASADTCTAVERNDEYIVTGVTHEVELIAKGIEAAVRRQHVVAAEGIAACM